MSRASVTITIGVPDRCLSPNHKPGTRGAMMKKARLTKSYRYACGINAMGASHNKGPKFIRCVIHATWCGRTRNVLSMDRTNAIGSLKAAEDGLCDAGIILNDKGVEWGKIEFAVDKANPRIILIVEELSDLHAGAGGEGK